MTFDVLGIPWTQLIFGWMFVMVCLLLIGIILLQKGRGGGLSGAFGGAGGHSAFGSKTGDVFTYVTIVLAVLYLGFAILNNYTFRPLQLPTAAPAVAAPPAAATSAPPETTAEPTIPAATETAIDLGEPEAVETTPQQPASPPPDEP